MESGKFSERFVDMASTPGERKRRPLGVILIVELWGRLEGAAAAWDRRPFDEQLRDVVEHWDACLPESYLPVNADSVYREWLALVGKDIADVPFDISRLLTGPLPAGIEMQSIPIPAVHVAQLLPVDEEEYNIFIEDAASIGDGDPPLNEYDVSGLDLEVLELVRAKKVRRIRAYRVVKTVPGLLREYHINH